MSEDDDDDFLLHFFWFLFGLFFGLEGGKQFFNSTRTVREQKRLFKEYAEGGIVVPGQMLEQYVSGDETKIFHVIYGYNFPPVPTASHDDHVTAPYYKKEYSLQVRDSHREVEFGLHLLTFTVTVLPGYPKSGIPTYFIHHRDLLNANKEALCALLLIGFMPLLMLACFADELFLNVPFWKVLPISLGISCAFLIIGFPRALHTYDEWEHDILFKQSRYGEVTRPRSLRYYHTFDDVTNAEPVRESYTGGLHANVVSVSCTGGEDVAVRETYSSEDPSIVPPLVAAVPERSYGAVRWPDIERGDSCDVLEATVVDLGEGGENAVGPVSSNTGRRNIMSY